MPGAIEQALRHLVATYGGKPPLRAIRSLGPALHRHGVLEREEWARDLRQARAANVLLGAELARALETLRAADVPVMLIKGADTVERVYGGPGQRPMDDADLLVAPRDRARARARLETLGYALVPPERGRYGAIDERLQGEWTLRGPHGVEIDLHWHVVADARIRAAFPGLDDQAIWRRAETCQAYGAQALRPDRVDSALIAALTQATGHPWSHPLGYLDLHLLATELDRAGWATLAERALAQGIGAPVFWSLRFARELFGTEAPRSVMRALAPSAASRAIVGALVGGDWLGAADWRRDQVARDLYLALLVGPTGVARMLRAGIGGGNGWATAAPRESRA